MEKDNVFEHASPQRMTALCKVLAVNFKSSMWNNLGSPFKPSDLSTRSTTEARPLPSRTIRDESFSHDRFSRVRVAAKFSGGSRSFSEDTEMNERTCSFRFVVPATETRVVVAKRATLSRPSLPARPAQMRWLISLAIVGTKIVIASLN